MNCDKKSLWIGGECTEFIDANEFVNEFERFGYIDSRTLFNK